MKDGKASSDENEILGINRFILRATFSSMCGRGRQLTCSRYGTLYQTVPEATLKRDVPNAG
jgi:hypothetical protein